MPPLTDAAVSRFLETCDRLGFKRWHVHAPYVINLASPDKKIRQASVVVLRQELERAAALQAATMMTHLGSATGLSGKPEGLKLAAASLGQILAGYDGPTRPLIEISAGAGAILGDSFEDLAAILDLLGNEHVGICFDTAHAFASGYDLRDSASVQTVLRRFDELIGLEKLAVIHVNDSVFGLGKRRDRHAHLGQGEIGLDGVRALVESPQIRDLDLILETPLDGRGQDIETLRRLLATGHN